MRASRVFRRVVRYPDTVIESTDFDEVAGAVIVRVRVARRGQQRCGRCRRRCPWYDRGRDRRRWRALDVGDKPAYLEADAPRVRCAEHGVVVAAVPWARHDAGHTVDFDAQVAWLARQVSKTAVCALQRIAWRTVGQIITRVVAEADKLAGDRLDGLRRIGIDEISYRRGHKYLTVVVDHDTGRLVWAAPGRDKATLAQFFQLLGPARCARIALVSADGADWIFYAVAQYCPNARQCLDPFHVVAWAGKALDDIRAQVHTAARRAGQKALARELKDSRYALWKRPADLTAAQKAKLSFIQATNAPLYRAYLLKEQLRQVFAAGGEERVELLDAWLAWAARSRLAPFVDLARRIRVHFRPDIINTLVHRLSNGRIESVNTKIRLLTRIAFGFHSPQALIALAKLHLGGYQTDLPGRS